MLKFAVQIVLLVYAASVLVDSVEDKAYPPILLLNEMMGMASSPLPTLLRKVIKSCEDFPEVKQSEIFQNNKICLQSQLPDIQNPNLNALQKYKMQCAVLTNSTLWSCYAEMMKEVESHDCFGNFNYTKYIFKFTHTLVDVIMCEEPEYIFSQYINNTEDNISPDNRKKQNTFYCYDVNRKQNVDNCIIKALNPSDRESLLENTVCDDFEVMKTCLEKHYVSSRSCKQQASVAKFFEPVLERLENAVCQETYNIPIYTDPANHPTSGHPDENSTVVPILVPTTNTTDSDPDKNKNNGTPALTGFSGTFVLFQSIFAIGLIFYGTI